MNVALNAASLAVSLVAAACSQGPPRQTTEQKLTLLRDRTHIPLPSSAEVESFELMQGMDEAIEARIVLTRAEAEDLLARPPLSRAKLSVEALASGPDEIRLKMPKAQSLRVRGRLRGESVVLDLFWFET